MKFSVLTLFPEQIRQNLATSVTGRALERGLFSLNTVQIRDYAINAYGQVDDALYGGGSGMLLRPEPVYDAWLAATARRPVRTIVMAPSGRSLNHALVAQLAQETELVVICGHYEGIDARVLDEIGAEPVSIGDYVLSGGELAACVLMDAVCRLLPGVLPQAEAWQEDSFACGLLEEPQYTRPPLWRGREVPDVLRSGHAARIEQHRRFERIRKTLALRPDLLREFPIGTAEWENYWKWAEENN